MLKKIMMTTLAVGALALGAPAAHAEHAEVDCGFNTVAQETATGGQDTYTGVAYGYVVSANEAVSISCFVRVAGNDQLGTPTGTGNSFATTQGQVTYTASDSEEVLLCAEWSAGAETNQVTCFPTINTQIPPQPVIDALDQVFDLITEIEITVVDPLLCPVLRDLGVLAGGGIPGVLEINEQGDVFLLGEPFWDCPPYDLFPPEG